MNLQEIRAFVRDITDEPDTDVWTDAQINAFINEAYRQAREDLVYSLRNYGSTVLDTQIDGTAQYVSLTDNNIFIIDYVGVKETSDDTYTPIRFKNILRLLEDGYDLSETGTPTNYYLREESDERIYFYPTPSSTYDVRIVYRKTISSNEELVNDTDEPSLVPASLHRAIGFMAASYMTHKDEASNNLNVFLNLYNRFMTDYIAKAGGRFKDEKRYIYER